MGEEIITANGSDILCRVITIPGDGACLFSSLAYLVHGDVSMAAQIRADIVRHVSNEWQRFKYFSMDRHGAAYGTKRLYIAEMSRPYTYGTTCELKAAGEIFPFEFQLFQDGILIATFGEAEQEIKRIRFSGSFSGGHFDALIPLVETTNTDENDNFQHTPTISETINSELDSSSSAIESQLTTKRGKKRRKRFTDVIRKKQVKEAVQKHTKNNPKSHRVAVKKYTKNHPEVNRKAVKKYSTNNPHVNQASATKYNKKRTEMRLLAWKIKHMSGFEYNPNIDYSKDKIVDLGIWLPCTWCHALKWREEPNGMCCSGGKVQLDSIERFPEPLHSLLTNQHVKGEHFLSSIRKYNGCFQMTSFGAKKVNEGNFMPTFKVQGQVYHQIGSITVAPQHEPSFLQIYFVGDDESERNIRCGIYSGVNRELVDQLQKLLHENNKYILGFKAAIDSVPKGQKDYKVIINANRKPFGEHQGRFNAPTCKEVAVLIVGQEFEKRDIVLHSRNNRVVRISETHRAYDALQYPLMFCRGEDGYQIDIPQRDPKTNAPLKKTVSAANFYSYRLMKRDSGENYILSFRNLLNQYLVDMYAKIETERLNWIRNNQKKLRSEEYVHLKDAMSRADTQIKDFGKMVVLPSSFTGGARYMHERTQDAMTYVRHFGRPDLFITFTCNPKWTEIVELLKQGQKSHDRHDLIARVFHLKVKNIMKLLTKSCIFGNVHCQMYTVEWQKRGLPHIHILLWLEQKIRPESIDKVISAEIPDPELDPALHEIVKTTMIHGPCGTLNRNSPCMVNGACSKKYPRPLLKETQTGDDGYPQYRRRSVADGGFTAKVGGLDLENRWVVPYSPVLSRIFSAHINVELCNSVKSIKYICKYVNKGSDQATFKVGDLDEVTRYETGRYISSSEAAWRIFCFSIHERYPPIVQLAVHLENGQRVYFTESNVVDKIINPSNTTLLGFFELCQVDAFARTLLYCEVPAYYIWKNQKFHRRKQGQPVTGYPGVKKDKVLGRVYTVHPNNSECYYLRLLLHEVRGPTSFTTLKTVAGIVHPTFHSACKSLGLLEDDANWDHTLEEASLFHSPNRIRDLFAVILVFCQVGDPENLWKKHRGSLAEDIKRQIERERGNVQLVQDYVFNRCLILIEDIVISMSGKTLTQFGLPSPSREQEPVVSNRIYHSEISYDTVHLNKEVAANLPKLNDDQKKVYEDIMNSVTTESGKLFFLDAPGGTGKTFLINLLLATIRSRRNVAIAVASSGIAATLIDGGKTAHSAFRLPLNLNYSETPLCNISKQSDMAEVLRKAKIIVWDECTMAHKKCIEALDRTLQDIRSCNRLMGGVTILLAGDFRQTLPVVPRGTRADEVKACLKSSFLWPKVNILTLRVNMRVQHDSRAKQFSKLLLDIGNGHVSEEEGKINIPNNLGDVVVDLNSLTDRIYPNVHQTEENCASWLRERAILTARNDDANSINNILLKKLLTAEVKYESVDTVLQVDDAVNYPVEFLNTLHPPGIPPHILYLKVGAPIILLRNLNPPKLCNGTRLQVKALHKHVIEATIFTGIYQGETVFIPRIPLIPSDYQFEFKRLQYPVKLCYAMTINKAQGQTLKIVGVDLRNDCFSHGQLYVACSRVTSPNGLVMLQPEKKKYCLHGSFKINN